MIGGQIVRLVGKLLGRRIFASLVRLAMAAGACGMTSGEAFGQKSSAPAETYTNGIGMEFISVSAGNFMMGSTTSAGTGQSSEVWEI